MKYLGTNGHISYAHFADEEYGPCFPAGYYCYPAGDIGNHHEYRRFPSFEEAREYAEYYHAIRLRIED